MKTKTVRTVKEKTNQNLKFDKENQTTEKGKLFPEYIYFFKPNHTLKSSVNTGILGDGKKVAHFTLQKIKISDIFRTSQVQKIYHNALYS